MNLDPILFKQYSVFARNLPELLLRAAEVLELEAKKTGMHSTLADQLTDASQALCVELGWYCLECSLPAVLIDGLCINCIRSKWRKPA